jgi:DNA-binding ferritin-like protein
MKIEDFILLIKSSEVNAHIYHWNTDSFAAHKALEGYYEAARDLVDKLTEVAQGRFATKFELKGSIDISELDYITYFSNLSSQTELMINSLFKEYKDLENIALEILEEINKIRYLLTLS